MADGRYRTSLTGLQVDDALRQLNERVAEGWAEGTRDGNEVGSDSPYYHNNAKYYAEIAKSATPTPYSAAVRWDEDMDLADSDKARARANISAGASNRNLLDNPWFTVNQRNFTTSTGVNNFYSVDRWYIARGTGTISKTNNGITINGVGASRETTFQQMIDCGDLTGRTVALSVNDGGTIRQITGIVPARTTSNNIFIRFTLRDGVSAFLYAMAASSAYAYMLQFQVNAGYTIDLRAVKLELGSYSTLANDVPPNYAEELAKCQYYCRVIQGTSFIAVGQAVASTVIRFPLPYVMRTKPTATLTGTAQVYGQGGPLTPSALSCTGNTTQDIEISTTVSGATATQSYMLVFSSANDKIVISADL